MLYSYIVKKRIRQSFDHLNNHRWDEVLKAVAGGKADIEWCYEESLLLTRSGQNKRSCAKRLHRGGPSRLPIAQGPALEE